MYAADGDPDTVAGAHGKLPLYKMLGYFSLIGLLRLHSLLGDYHQAIKVLGSVDLNKKVSCSHCTFAILIKQILGSFVNSGMNFSSVNLHGYCSSLLFQLQHHDFIPCYTS